MKETKAIYQSENAATVQNIDRSIYVNFSYLPHMHPRMELIYVMDGAIDISIDGMDMKITAAEYCIVLPWQIHSFKTDKYSKIIIFVIPGRIAANFLEKMKYQHGETQVFRAEKEIDRLFKKYMVESSECNEYILTSIIYGLCHCFLSECKLVNNENRERNEDIQRVLKYISVHSHEKLALKTVADELGYGYYYLSRLFSKEIKIGFYEFCGSIRIENAIRYLSSSNLTVTQIAYECGFSSIRTFNRAFKQFTGMSPSEYRIYARNNPYSYVSNKYMTTTESVVKNNDEEEQK